MFQCSRTFYSHPIVQAIHAHDRLDSALLIDSHFVRCRFAGLSLRGRDLQPNIGLRLIGWHRIRNHIVSPAGNIGICCEICRHPCSGNEVGCRLYSDCRNGVSYDIIRSAGCADCCDDITAVQFYRICCRLRLGARHWSRW